MRLDNTLWLLLAAGGLLLPATAAANDPSAEGVVRLGTSSHPVLRGQSLDTGLIQHTGFHSHSSHDAGYCGTGCPSGYCGSFSCGCPCGDGCYPGCGCGCSGCGYGGSCFGRLHHYLATRPVGGCSFPPDHGWAPPGKHPRPRTAVTYRRWFPASWTGEPLSVDPYFRYPMVTTPTDTTQLGYYYQRVPVWQARPGMIPPVPQPDAFHVPNFGVRHCGFADAGPYGWPGAIISDYPTGDVYSDGSGTPAEPAPTDAQPPTPQAAPAAPAPYMPSPSQPQPPSAAPPGAVPPPPAPAPEPPPAAKVTEPGVERSASAPHLQPIPSR